MNPLIEQRIQAAYDNSPTHIKANVYRALKWAKKTLTEYEGTGHHIQIHRERDGKITCSFAKPIWSGDHCSRRMDTGAEAVVMAVCEYLNGG